MTGIKVAANQVAPTVGPKAQVQQYLNVECQDVFPEGTPSCMLLSEVGDGDTFIYCGSKGGGGGGSPGF